MKRLTCEMCGSTDLVKDGGVFVCQACGCKYSIEEAKKMMIEGKVEVTGTVQIDASKNVENLLQLARAGLSQNDNASLESALNYARQVTEINPGIPEAWIIMIEAYGKLSTVGKAKEFTEKTIAAGKNAIAFSPDEKRMETTEQVYRAFLEHAVVILTTANKKLSDNSEINGFLERRSQALHDITWTIAIEKVKDEMRNSIYQQTNDFINDQYQVSNMWNASAQTAVDLAFEVTEDALFSFDHLIPRMKSVISEYKKETEVFNRRLALLDYHLTSDAISARERNMSKLQSRIDNARERQKKAQEEKRKAAIEEYWRAHETERKALEEERAGLTEQIGSINESLREKRTALNEEMIAVSREEEVKAIDARIRSFSDSLSALGIFKMKEKKELQARIADEKKKKDAVLAAVESPKREVQTRIDDAERQAKAAILPLQSRIDAINGELTKDR